MNLGRWQRTIVDLAGNVIAGAVITIRRESDQQLVTVYGDKTGEHPYTPTGQATADANGYVYFYVEPGLYRITSSNPAVDWRDVEIGSVEIAQEVDQSWRDFEAQAEYEHDNLRAMLMQSRYGDGPYPTIDWQFAGASRLDPRITFSRASADTVFDASGKLVTLGNDVPAFPYDPATGKALGFRVQAQATNTLNGSDSPSAYSLSGLLSPVSTSVRAGYNVGFAIPDTNNTAHYVDLLGDSAAADGSINSAQCVLSVGDFSSFGIQCWTGGSTALITLNLDVVDGDLQITSASSGVTVSLLRLADDCYLVKMEGFTAPAGTSARRIRIYPKNPSSTFPGNGSSGFYYGGFMWEEGVAKCSSYIGTAVGSQGTRAADNPMMYDSGWFNKDEGTLIISITPRVLNDNQFFFSFERDSNPPRVLYGYHKGNTDAVVAANSVVTTVNFADIGITGKLGITYKGGEFKVVGNGTFSGTGTYDPALMAAVTMLRIGRSYTEGFGSFGMFNGEIPSISYYPRALSDAQLQALTS